MCTVYDSKHLKKPDLVQKHLPWPQNRAENKQSARQLQWSTLAMAQTTEQQISTTLHIYCHQSTSI